MKELIERLKELEAKSTPAPWAAGLYDGEAVIHGPEGYPEVVTNPGIEGTEEWESEDSTIFKDPRPIGLPIKKGRTDGCLIAEFRNAAPQIFEYIAQLEATVAELEEELQYRDEVLAGEDL